MRVSDLLAPAVVAALMASGAAAPAHAQWRAERSFVPAPLPAPVVPAGPAWPDSAGVAPVALSPDTSGAGPGRTNAVLAASLGSLAGLVVGAWVGGGPLYDATGCCGGGDDPGLVSALALGGVGSTVGSAAGAVLVGGHPWSRAVPGSVLGVGVGLLAGAIGGAVAGLPGGALGYGLGHGFTTVAVATPP